MYLKGVTAPFGWTSGWAAPGGLEYLTHNKLLNWQNEYSFFLLVDFACQFTVHFTIEKTLIMK